jgi:hypothetical protein
MELSLDAPMPIVEDDAACVLCSHKYLELEEIMFNQYRVMATRCTKNELYNMLFGMLQKHREQLHQQGICIPVITKDVLINHFENHDCLSLERAIVEDLRLIKKMSKVLCQNMHSKKGLDDKSVKLWVTLSNHKLNLLAKVSQKRVSELKTRDPYIFD